MKTVLALAFFCLLQYVLSAQTIGGNLEGFPRKMDPCDTLDYTYLNVHYRQIVREDKLVPDKLTESEMVLQIGKQISKYSNYKLLMNDSIMAAELERPELSMSSIVNSSLARIKKAGDRSTVVKNYPEGQYLFQKGVLLDAYSYQEDIPVFDWTIAEDTLTVSGYLCRKATCRFRGRDYIAWYAPDIPLSNGPWKFNGLPGLILKVEDTGRDYSFECAALYQVGWQSPVYVTKRKREIKTTREKFNQVEKTSMNNPGATMVNSGLVTIPNGGEMSRKKFPYNPIELE